MTTLKAMPGFAVLPLLLAAGPSRLAAQTALPPAGVPAAVPASPGPGPEVRKPSVPIGAGDTVSVSVLDEGDLQQSVQVNDLGEADLHLLGAVRLAGLTAAEAAALLERLYREKDLLRDPQVSIEVQHSFHQTVSVLGEVVRPGTVDLNTARPVLDVLSLVGGFTATADRHVTIREGGDAAHVSTVFISNNAEEAVRAGSALVHPGDTVVVPKAGVVYMLGDMARPGGFVMQNDSRLTLLEALALAGGTLHTAGQSKARLLRRTATGYQDQHLDLEQYEKGKLPDFELQANDVVYVPFSLGKNVIVGASNILSGVGGAALYALP